MPMTVDKTTLFLTKPDILWNKLQSLNSLQYVSTPYASFSPVEKRETFLWKEGESYSLKLKIFGLIPMGIHKIEILRIDKETLTICSKESNAHVPVWNHTIILRPIDKHTQYRDLVEISAGWKTPFIYLWAKSFYAHRQRKWRQLLEK